MYRVKVSRRGGRGGGRWLVAVAVAEHRENDVAAAGQADDGSVTALALCVFAIVVVKWRELEDRYNAVIEIFVEAVRREIDWRPA